MGIDVRRKLSGRLDRLVSKLPARLNFWHRTRPISRSFGLERGWPVDRYYIEAFLGRHAGDIKGHVLEAGGLVSYTRRFGRGVTRADVLYPKAGHADGTFIGNLETGWQIPSDTFDCLVLTQVYPFIFDLPSAVRHTFRALKPGGVLLASFPGISQICRYDREQWGDYWRFTDMSVQRLFAPVFGAENVEVEAHGNVLAACAFLHGMASRELRPDELLQTDRDYQLTITLRAVRPQSGAPRD